MGLLSDITTATIADDIVAQAYEGPVVYQARRLVEMGRVVLSFVKGSLEQHLVVSGMVSENNATHETRFTWKKEGLTFKATCNCKLYEQERTCVHGAALWLRWRQFLQAGEETKISTSAGPSFFGEGVRPERYGTLVKLATYLQGAKPSATFAALTYMLTNRQVINWPTSTRWSGKLVVNLIPTDEHDQFRDLPAARDKHVAVYSWMTPEGEEVSEVSLFDVFTLFNWRAGAALDLPSPIVETLKRVKHQDMWLPINEWLRLFRDANPEQIDFRIEGKAWKDIIPEPVNWRFSITPSPRKSFLNLQLELHDAQDRLILPPEPFKIYVTEAGWAGTFRSKNDAVNFLKHLTEDFDRETNLNRKHLHGAGQKQRIMDWSEGLFTETEIPFWDPAHRQFYTLPTSTFKKTMLVLLDCFTENAWRTVFMPAEDRRVIFQMPKNTILDAISPLHTRLLAMGIPLLYNDVPIRAWKAAIRFERHQRRLDWFELDLIVPEEDLEIIRQAEVGDNYIITDKGLVLLTDQEKDLLRFMKRYTKHEGEKKEGVGPGGTRRFGLTLNRARVFELFELKKLGIDGALTAEEEQFCLNIINLESMPQYELPDRYKEIARPYQSLGFNWLRFLWENKFGACLADDMGLGKTLQAIMLLQSLVEQKKIKRALIICPVSILYNWKNELEKFSTLKYGIFYGEEREIPEETQVVLTSYGLMKKESLGAFAQETFDVIIFDEVQHLKNIRSLGANAARQLKGTFRICLTGTPVENDLAEFYNIMDLCVPGVWGDMSLVRSSSKAKNRLLARRTVKPFILRRTKEQVLKELPEKIENHVFLDFSDLEREQYKARLDAVRTQMANPAFTKRYGEVLKSLLELRQLCLWQKQGPTLNSTKIEFLMENLEQLMEENHKVLVFSQFTTYLDLIQDKIREKGWKFARIDGSQAVKKRAEQVEYFQNGEAQVFLISLKAGGVGLNLTAASYIFLMDPWWNPAVERQAVDRAHRIGQENKLTVYRPLIKGSVEEKVLLLQQAKRELFRDLMAEDDDQYFSGKLTKDDFSMLLG